MRRTPFDNQFSDFESIFENMLGNRLNTPLNSRIEADVMEYEDEFEVIADIPGFSKDEIDIELPNDRTLVISASSTGEDESDEESEENVVRRERMSRFNVERTIRFRAPVSAEDTTATYKNGVLSLTLPKKDRSDSGHRIDIE